MYKQAGASPPAAGAESASGASSADGAAGRSKSSGGEVIDAEVVDDDKKKS
jgi:hypothetical protein